MPRNNIARLFAIVGLILAATCSAYAQTIINGVCYGVQTPGIPTGTFDTSDPAGKDGYQLVFDSEFNDMNDFDLSCNAAPTNGGCLNPPGKNWYLDGWTFPTSRNTTAASNMSITNGVLAVHQTIGTGGWAVGTFGPKGGASQGPAGWQQNWNGHVFGGGWYVESRVS